jgi:hypothetical protein
MVRRGLKKLWFVTVDHELTRILEGPKSVEVPSDGYIEDFLDEVKKTEILDESGGKLTVWKLHTPQPIKKIQEPGFLANIRHPEEIPEEEEDEEDVGAEAGKGKGKAKAKERPASPLTANIEISTLFDKDAPQGSICALVQITPLAGMSYYTVSARCQLIRLLQLFLMFLFKPYFG